MNPQSAIKKANIMYFSKISCISCRRPRNTFQWKKHDTGIHETRVSIHIMDVAEQNVWNLTATQKLEDSHEENSTIEAE